LKTLEEPPDRVTFVMATTQPEDLADTIRSRSQHFHFRALTFAEITARLQEVAQKENLQIETGALAVIGRMAEGSLRDALSLLEQARAYCGENITTKEVRDLLGVVPDDALAELVAAIQEGSADRALGLIHTFQKEGRNLQHFCREAIRHMRNLLIAKVCGADSDLIAATPDQRPALAEAAAYFSEEDLTRFFQILLETEDDLRRKPDPRVHLEMGLLRLINAARLAPLEELLTELKTGNGGETSSAVPWRRAAAASVSSSFNASPPATSAIVGRPALSSAPVAKPIPASPAENIPAKLRSSAPNGGTASATAAATAPSSRASVATAAQTNPIANPFVVSPQTGTIKDANDGIAESLNESKSVRSVSATNGAKEPDNAAGDKNNFGELRVDGLSEEQVSEIKSAIQKQQKFLGELLEHAGRWELEGTELKIYFPTEKKTFAEMLEGRDSLEKLRATSSTVLGRPIRVCAKLETGKTPAPASRIDAQELRAKFERDPMVRSLLQRFGGKISEVRRPQEE
ncbi:MAG: hypothetical protein M3N22_09950, partial [Acidobacteriota bacterium]|nr:hypothetical protein [Acidobacteriota bacterium]